MWEKVKRSILPYKESLSLTLVIWGAIILGLAFFPVKKKPVYHSISLRLESPALVSLNDTSVLPNVFESETVPDVQVTQSPETKAPETVSPEMPLTVSENILLDNTSTVSTPTSLSDTPPLLSSTRETPSEGQTTTPLQTSDEGPSQAAESAESSGQRRQVLQPSIEEAMANLEKKSISAKDTFSEADFEKAFGSGNTREYSSGTRTVDAVTQNTLAQKTESSLSGSVGSVTGSGMESAGKNGVSTASSQKSSDLTTVSETTASGLQKLRMGKNFVTKSSSGTEYNIKTDVNISYKGDTGTELFTDTGRSLVLLEPSHPVIVISPEKEALINSSREVTITFTVNSSGLVDPNSITITPSAMLPVEIQGEIKDQIATWRFLVPSSYEGYGQVSFNYNIIKR